MSVSVFLEDSDHIFKQCELLKGLGVRNIVIGGPTTDREERAIQVLRGVLENLDISIVIPLINNYALIEDCLQLCESLQVSSIILRIGCFGENGVLMDPSGFEITPEFFAHDVYPLIHHVRSMTSIPIEIYPVRSLGRSPNSYYTSLIGEICRSGCTLSLDLGFMLADEHNWNLEIDSIMKFTSLESVSSLWIWNLRREGKSKIPCACQPLSREIMDIVPRIDQRIQLVLMTDRLLDDTAFVSNCTLLTRRNDQWIKR